MFNYFSKINDNRKHLLLYLKLKLKNIKFKADNQNSQMNSGAVRIIPYTEKSFVVVGDTKPHKDSIKNLGGKWNASLTNKETGEKFMGWIFFLNKGKQNEVQNWIDGGCLPVGVSAERGGEESKRGFEKILFPAKSESKSDFQTRKVSLSPIRTDVDRISQLENTVATLLKRLASLEEEVKLLSLTGGRSPKGGQVTQVQTTQGGGDDEYEEIDVEEEVEIEVPVQNKRLLRR